MSKVIEGAALIGAAIAVTVATGGVGAIAAVGFEAAFAGAGTLGAGIIAVAAAGVAMEAGAISSALTANRGMNITTRQPAAARQIIYGMQRVGGVSVYQSTTGSTHNQYNYAICIAGHPCWAIEALYLDGRKVWWAGNQYGYAVQNGIGFGGYADGNSREGPDGTQYWFAGDVFAIANYGTQTAADLIGGFTANDPNWNTSALGTPYLGGCTWFYLKLEYDPNNFPSAPEIRATVYGKSVYDPRTGTTAYSANSALVAADWLQDTVYGLGMKVNQAQLIAAANVCDEHVPLAAGGFELRYQCHYHFDSSTGPSDALATMLKSMGGRFSVIGGEVYLWPAYWQGPSANFDQHALTAPVQWDPTAAYKDNGNRVTGTYTAPNYPYNALGNLYDSNGFDPQGNVQNNFQFGFQATNFPSYAEDPLHGYAADQWLNEDSHVSGAWAAGTTYALGQVISYTTMIGTVPYYSVYKSLIAGNGGNIPGPNTSTVWQLAAVELPVEVNYTMVLSIAQAQRLAKIDLLRRRFWGRGTLEMGLSAYAMQECDVMNFTFPLHGWMNKQLEILDCTFKVIAQDGDPGQPPKPPECRISFDVAETDISVYEWSSIEELTIYALPGPQNYQSRTPAPPTNLTLISSAATALVNVDGVVTPRIEVTWGTPLDILAIDIEIQYQAVGDSAWQTAGFANIALNNFFFGPVRAGNQYSVRIRSRRNNNSVSVWVGPVTSTAGVVLSVQTQSGVGRGSLVATAFGDGTAAIQCNPFTALIGQLSLPIFPGGAVTLYSLAQQTLYYVYYVDPTSAGGNVIPIATTNPADFTGKLGYWLIDSIVTGYYVAGGAPRSAPTSFSDTGTRSSSTPSAAYDNNLSTAASITGQVTNAGSGHGITFGTGICTFLGFPSGSSTSVRTLTVNMAASMTGTGGTVVLSVSVAGTSSTVATLTATTADTMYNFSVAAGVDIGTISVKVTATAGGSPPVGSSYTVAGIVYEIYIQ